MRDSLQALFDYAIEERIPAYLKNGRYQNHTREMEKQEKHFLSLLSPDESRRLEEYFSAASYKGLLEMEAAFRAGIAAALDLLRS